MVIVGFSSPVLLLPCALCCVLSSLVVEYVVLCLGSMQAAMTVERKRFVPQNGEQFTQHFAEVYTQYIQLYCECV